MSATTLVDRATLAATMALAIVLGACVRDVAPEFATASELPDVARRPDAIAVDLRSDPPVAQDVVAASSDVVSLRTPIGIGAAHESIAELFAAIVDEDNPKLSAVVNDAVIVHDLSKAGAPPRNALHTWRQRFRKYNYQRLQDATVFRLNNVSVFRPAEFDRLPHELAGTAAKESDLVLRVPILTPEVRNERLWGSELFVWFERHDGRYMIVGMAEELPF